MKVLIVACACFVALALSEPEGPPGPPPFLEGASKATVDAWNALVQTFGGDTEKQINDAVTKFVAEHAEIKDKFEKFKKQVIADQKAAEEQHKTKVGKLSKDAQAADKKLADIADDAGLTQDQKQKKIIDLFNGLPAAVQTELKSAGQ